VPFMGEVKEVGETQFTLQSQPSSKRKQPEELNEAAEPEMDTLILAFKQKNEEIGDLQNELDRSKKELGERSYTLELELSEQAEKSKTAMEDASKAQERTSALEKELQDLKEATAKSSPEEVQEARRSIQDLEFNNQAMTDEKKKIQNERKELLDIVDKQGKIIEELEAQMQEATLNREAPKSSIEEELADSKEEARTLRAELEELGEAADHIYERLEAMTDEKKKIQNERKELLDIVDKQRKRIEELEAQMQETTLNREAPKASTEDELADSKEEAKTLRAELEELGEAADQGGAVAELELEKLGAVAVSELEQVGQTVKSLQSQKGNQAKTINMLEQRLLEQQEMSAKVESRLREQLAKERMNRDSLSTRESLHRNSYEFGEALARLSLAIPENEQEQDWEVSSLGSASVVSQSVSQSDFLEGALRKKRESTAWSRFSAMVLDIEEGNASNLNELLREEKRRSSISSVSSRQTPQIDAMSAAALAVADAEVVTSLDKDEA
jgi:chromosome segregation ATPase